MSSMITSLSSDPQPADTTTGVDENGKNAAIMISVIVGASILGFVIMTYDFKKGRFIL